MASASRTDSNVAPPHGEILKNSTPNSSSVLGLSDPEKQCLKKKAVLTLKKNGRCHTELGQHFFSPGHPSPNAELEFDMGFFQNSSVGPSYAVICTGQRRLKRPKAV